MKTNPLPWPRGLALLGLAVLFLSCACSPLIPGSDNGAQLRIKVQAPAPRALSAQNAPVEAMDLAVRRSADQALVGNFHWTQANGPAEFCLALDFNRGYQLLVSHHWRDAAGQTGTALDAPLDFSLQPGQVTLLTVIPGGFAIIQTPPGQGYRVAGRVSALDGSGKAGVRVALAGQNPVATGADGSFAFEAVPAGSYTLETSLAGHSIVAQAGSRSVRVGDQSISGLAFTALPYSGPSIAAIQGAGHSSPLANQAVSQVLGVVTLVDAKQFWLQSLEADQDPASSEGILVYQNALPSVRPGDWIALDGLVTEYQPNGASSGNLTVTEIKNPVISILARDRALPDPVLLGQGGRLPPDRVICDDANGPVETSPFDPDSDGIDFWESLEGIRVRVDQALACGPSIHYASSGYRETPLLADAGAGASGLNARGGLLLSATDANPEIVTLNDKFFPAEPFTVGDRLDGALVGVLDYNYGIYKIMAGLALPRRVPGNLQRESNPAPTDPGLLRVAGFNAENLSAASEPAKLAAAAATIVGNLGSPDIVVVCEIQDNNGPAAGSTDAGQSWSALSAAILAAGGPAYEARDIAPENNQDGGATNGNIRQGFLFQSARVSFVDRPGGSATADTQVSLVDGQAQLSASPGRIKPSDPAFAQSRKPLAGEFLFRGKTVILVANHFNSKGGDQGLYGRNQPPLLASESQRLAQARIVRGFADAVLAAQSDAALLLAGDFNDFEFTPALKILAGDETVPAALRLENLVLRVAAGERYSYVYAGNSQVLDHILVSPWLAGRTRAMDLVHCNAEWPAASRSSDHDPALATFAW